MPRRRAAKKGNQFLFEVDTNELEIHVEQKPNSTLWRFPTTDDRRKRRSCRGPGRLRKC